MVWGNCNCYDPGREQELRGLGEYMLKLIRSSAKFPAEAGRGLTWIPTAIACGC
jgi:hypothetical protein